MNTQQAIAYENTVIESAREWFLGESSIDGVEELALICQHYKINLKIHTFVHRTMYI